ncbi:SGNH/GDSL hydrolase family protein [Shewanella sp. GXUN23E]|uniref:SGNH/GDSL hydrolase family protein n=1 Tax=Shewanella sp. GXUN23E TaxID=3422498 RepID=UPI003D7E1498
MKAIHKLMHWSQLPLLPLILWQGKQVRKHTPRLNAAAGLPIVDASSHTPSNCNTVNILHVGESTVAGVGVNHLRQGLTANIIRTLKLDGITARGWIMGHSGATVADINRHAPSVTNPDVLLISLGVNDVVELTSEQDWQDSLRQCVAKFAGISTKVCFTQVPDMSRFPALPAPLNQFLGHRARQLHLALKALCEQNRWALLEVDLPIAGDWMAADGYHPNARGYKLWGQALARQLQHLP